MSPVNSKGAPPEVVLVLLMIYLLTMGILSIYFNCYKRDCPNEYNEGYSRPTWCKFIGRYQECVVQVMQKEKEEARRTAEIEANKLKPGEMWVKKGEKSIRVKRPNPYFMQIYVELYDLFIHEYGFRLSGNCFTEDLYGGSWHDNNYWNMGRGSDSPEKFQAPLDQKALESGCCYFFIVVHGPPWYVPFEGGEAFLHGVYPPGVFPPVGFQQNGIPKREIGEMQYPLIGLEVILGSYENKDLSMNLPIKVVEFDPQHGTPIKVGSSGPHVFKVKIPKLNKP